MTASLNSFGGALRQARRARGLSAAALGTALGVSATYVQNLEAGTTWPTPERRVELANLLGLDADWLVVLEAVDRGRLPLPSGVTPEQVAECLRQLGQPVSEHGLHGESGFACPHCGKRCVAAKG